MAVENMSSSASSSSSSSDCPQECPLCLETLDLDDRSFYPCTCGYQICRFCWHRILSESSIEAKGSCPACRKPYSENPANFEPLSVDEVQAKLKKQRKQKESQKKQKSVDSRKHLGELRVVQKNLVFVVGITPRIADPDLLKKNEYFGRFGKIHKIVVNSVGNSGSNGTSNNSYGAYITYIRSDDALRAIQSVNNIPFDGKTIKASLGTTKYCSHFMRNQSCPKPDCMYLHAQGDPEASFTKEDMQQGKHQEYERKLIDEFNKEQQIHLAQKSPSPPLSKSPSPPTPPPIIKQEEEEVEEVLKDKEPEEEPPKEEENKEIVEELLKPTELLSLLDNSLDFDPFYETQKAFESIIQQEMQQQTYSVGTRVVSPPPGFCNNNLWQHQTQPQTQQPQQSTSDDWIDPAIIYSSRGGGRSQPQTNGLGHLLGNSLLNEVFNGGTHQIGGHQPPQQQQQQNHVNGFIYPQQFAQPAAAPGPPANFFFNGTSKFPPPPGFGGSTPSGQAHHHQQFINNNFFNNFPF